MARRVEFGKFLIIECTAGELMSAVGSEICICDWCGKSFIPFQKGYYIAVLNQWYDKKCYEDWCKRATWYPQDADIERRNFDFYANRFGLICD